MRALRLVIILALLPAIGSPSLLGSSVAAQELQSVLGSPPLSRDAKSVPAIAVPPSSTDILKANPNFNLDSVTSIPTVTLSPTETSTSTATPTANATPTPSASVTPAVESEYGIKSLFDSIHAPSGKSRQWYEKLSIRGYTQFRFSNSMNQDLDTGSPYLFGDRSINGTAENFSIRRARLILFGDVSDHLGIYIQPDFASTPSGSTSSTFFGQLRDAYGDVYIDTDKVHRVRVGLSKIPFGFENMQSSQNRGPLDRTNAINTGASPNERDLGIFYYWTPVEKQKLFRELVDGGLKGSGNFGILGVGVYNGQGGSQFEQNSNVHTIARATWPWQLSNGQVVETSIQGYFGENVVSGAEISPFGKGDLITPKGTGGNKGHRDQRIAGSFVWYPQPFGFQAEWNVGEGPGLNDKQTAVDVRDLTGGYLMTMYRWDSMHAGIFMPFVRWQYYKGGYRSLPNAPYGVHNEWNFGMEWQIRREMELVFEYDLLNSQNLNTISREGRRSYRDFDGGVFRIQFQVNY